MFDSIAWERMATPVFVAAHGLRLGLGFLGRQYLRLRDKLGVCLSYCCLFGTTCILVIVQNITTSLLLLCTWYTVS